MTVIVRGQFTAPLSRDRIAAELQQVERRALIATELRRPLVVMGVE